MSDHPGFGTKGAADWPTILYLLNKERVLHKPNIFGNNVEHLMRHCKNEWCNVSAKVKALKGGDGLRWLQEYIQINVSYESDVEMWAGADSIDSFEGMSDNTRIPRRDDKDIG